ncbi:hypothetical protein LINPERPRIM_LOCUS20638, partial [Linum perenne]
VVRLLTESPYRSHQHSNLVDIFQEFQTRDWEITLHHIYREANNVAYFLSNSGLEFELGISVFTYPWNTLIEWISYDLLGICLPRQINIIQ